ncbi:MAG TPA: response regulator [Nitrospira sp.]|nr:response regulator [Nitrospira sp.]
MALAIIEVEPKKAMHLASYSLNSETGQSSSAYGETQKLAERTHNRTEPQTAHSALIVEDDPDIALALQDLLEFEGFEVDYASTCRQAFASITQNTYDVVLLDLGLPDGDGSSILNNLHVSHPSLPVIILSASNRDLSPLPAFAHVTKPWVRKELCNLLHQALESTPAAVTQ